MKYICKFLTLCNLIKSLLILNQSNAHTTYTIVQSFITATCFCTTVLSSGSSHTNLMQTLSKDERVVPKHVALTVLLCVFYVHSVGFVKQNKLC
jgi:hypothetical protein